MNVARLGRPSGRVGVAARTARRVPNTWGTPVRPYKGGPGQEGPLVSLSLG